MSDQKLANGRVVAAYGRHFLVEADDGRVLSSVTRGKRSTIACGDRVAVLETGPLQGVIEAVDPRSSLFMRSAMHRSKAIAANITQVAVVVATEPSFSDEVIARVLVAVEQQRLSAFIVLNKIDLAADKARERLQPFALAGYPVVEISAIRDVSPLRARLPGHTTLLVGQSGMGKSTLLNAVVPEAKATTQEISKFLASGRHTTTAVRLYPLEGSSALIDCPGFQEFGLAHLSLHDIDSGFAEFRPFLGACRFPNCRHDREPSCAIAAAAAGGTIHPRRLELFRRIAAAEKAR